MFDNESLKGITVLTLILCIIFAVFIGLYLTSLDTSGEIFVLTLNSFHDDVTIRFYNPLLLGETTINQGNTEFQLPQGHYKIVAEKHRDYSEDLHWQTTIELKGDMVVKVFD